MAPTHIDDGGAAVRIGDERRPEVATSVQLAAFEGPLGLLLSLIETRQLDIQTVPHGSLADAYLDALAGLEADRLGNISSFVAVASQLILIKSRAMLPRPPAPDPSDGADDGPDPEAALRARLILYRAYRDAGDRLLAEATLRNRSFHREPSTAHASGRMGALPADAPLLDPGILAGSLSRLVSIAPPPPIPPEVVPRMITLSERAAIIRAALADAPSVVLQDLLAGVRDRVVMAVTFLAMLELMKRREIVVEQAAPWGPIVARRTTEAERRGGGMAEETPIDETLGSFA
jgi:segregation and condensation protein A